MWRTDIKKHDLAKFDSDIDYESDVYDHLLWVQRQFDYLDADGVSYSDLKSKSPQDLANTVLN